MKIATLLILSITLCAGCAIPRSTAPLTTNIHPGLQWRLEELSTAVDCYNDRNYKPIYIPEELKGVKVIVRRKNEDKSWLPPGKIQVSKDCYVYVAIMTTYQGKPVVTSEEEWVLSLHGWRLFSNDFTSRLSSKDTWSIYRLQVTKGDIDLGDTSKLPTTALLFMIGD